MDALPTTRISGSATIIGRTVYFADLGDHRTLLVTRDDDDHPVVVVIHEGRTESPCCPRPLRLRYGNPG